MSETSLLHGSSCGDFSDDVEKIQSDIWESQFDPSKLKFMPRETVEKTLIHWRNEQLQKVEEELHMLRVIEDMMKKSDAEKFEGYTDKKKLAELMKSVRTSN